MNTAPTVTAGSAGTTVVLDDNIELTLEQAGNLGRALLGLRDELTPASPNSEQALSVALGAINAARGTSHTVESVMADLGIQKPLSVAEVSDIARHIGGVLMH